MYKNFFGFSRMPFNITPDPNFLYRSPTHQEALAHLKYGIEQKKGFIVLVGEVGCGKTTLCRALIESLDPQTTQTALILNPQVQPSQLLRDILKELGQVVSPKSDIELVGQIHDLLLQKAKERKNVVLIIDEAQNLSFNVLEQIRLLSNLETNSEKLLQILLIGQPELHQKLQHRSLRQLKQRILVYYDLQKLNYRQTCEYISHRLTLANSKQRPIFTTWALRKIYRRSKGIPRIINNICDKSLLSAFIKTSSNISYFDVRRAIKEIKSI